MESTLGPAPLATDVHAHLVPGVDDGSRDLPESITMARGLERLGVRRLHLTPHEFRFGPARGPERLRELVTETAAGLARAGVGLEIVASAEYLYGERLLEAVAGDEALATWPLSAHPGAGSAVLIELPLRDPVVGVRHLGERLRARGIVPVLAHPERVLAVQADPARAERWQEAGWRFQLDLLALVGAYGRAACDLAQAWLRAGRYALLGSDLHRASQLEALERAHACWRQLTAQPPEAA